MIERALPNLEVFAATLLELARFGKKPMPHLPRADAGFELGKASLIREGEDLSFLACGETVPRAFAAAQLLANDRP
jgi:transketolase